MEQFKHRVIDAVQEHACSRDDGRQRELVEPVLLERFFEVVVEKLLAGVAEQFLSKSLLDELPRPEATLIDTPKSVMGIV